MVADHHGGVAQYQQTTTPQRQHQSFPQLPLLALMLAILCSQLIDQG
jgi:hypothetical protein